jgi:hypothetical protein
MISIVKPCYDNCVVLGSAEWQPAATGKMDAVDFAGLCRPPNYAERFWKDTAVLADLRSVE